MIFVDTQQKLNNFVESAQASDIVCLDTEFMRGKTYFPLLCLIQAQTRDESYLIDPFELEYLTPLAKILNNDDVVKVFHAAEQDIEILYQEVGAIANPIFDTQIAASIVSGINQPGLANLLKNTLCVKIDKSEGFTDWSCRPLTTEQIKYAIEDVAYLPDLYDYQTSKMKDMGREDWLVSEFEDLANSAIDKTEPEERFIHLKGATHLTPYELCLARNVAAWREHKAMKRDIPRRWVLSDEQVCEICRRDPQDLESLFVIRGVRDEVSVSDARAILKALKRARAVDRCEWPEINGGNAAEANVTEAVFLMNALVRLRAKENCLSPQIIATNDQLTDLARGKQGGNKLIRGWRKKIVGDELVEILNGRIALSIDGDTLAVHHL